MAELVPCLWKAMDEEDRAFGFCAFRWWTGDVVYHQAFLNTDRTGLDARLVCWSATRIMGRNVKELPVDVPTLSRRRYEAY